MPNPEEPLNIDEKPIELPVSAQLNLSIVKDSADANGTDFDIANVTIDNAGDNVANVLIDFEITSGNAVFVDNNSKKIQKRTNMMLSASVKLTDLTGETGTIKASSHTNIKLSKTLPYTFVSVAPTATSLVLTVTKNNALADGKATDTIRATLTDANGAPVANQQLTFTIGASNKAKFTNGTKTISVTTDKNGQAVVSLTDISDADQDINIDCALDSNNNLKGNINAHYKANSVIKKFVLNVIKDYALADGIERNQVTATVLDQNGKSIGGQKLHLELPVASSATFTNGSKMADIISNAAPPATVYIIDKANTDQSVSVLGFDESNPPVLKDMVDVHFKTANIVQSFTLEAVKTPATAGIYGDYCQVKATIVPKLGSPSRAYTVRFKPSRWNPDINNGYFFAFAINDNRLGLTSDTNDHDYDAPITVNSTATVNANIVDTQEDTGGNAGVTCRVIAELLDQNLKVVATSNAVAVVFTERKQPVTPPPPPPQTDNIVLEVTAIRDNVRCATNTNYPNFQGLGNIAKIRLTKNGAPFANQEVLCNFTLTDPYNPKHRIANDAEQNKQLVRDNITTPLMRTNQNGEFTVTLAMWDYPGTGTLRVLYKDLETDRVFHWAP